LLQRIHHPRIGFHPVSLDCKRRKRSVIVQEQHWTGAAPQLIEQTYLKACSFHG
jgi:hypothetical protein